MQIQQAVQVSSTGWTSPSSPPSNSSGWSSFPPTQFPSDADLHFSSPKVQAWAVGNTMQLKAVKEVKTFFKAQKDESDDDDEDDDQMEESDSDDGSLDEEGVANGDYSGFFLKLFQENKELREFYEKNHENGEFGCLVCGGVGFIRRFKECVALVQHTVSISKTKKMKAHRAFGQVVCKVLGWDINKLPSSREKKNATSTKSEEEKISNEADNVERSDEESGDKESASAEHWADNGALAVSGITGNGSSIVTNLEENAPDIEQGSIEGSVDCLEAGPDNGSKYVGGDAGLSSVNEKSAAKTKEKDATGDERLPTTDILNLAQSLQSICGVGRNSNYLLKETLDGKQQNAESSFNCVEPRKEDGCRKNDSEDNHWV